MSLVLHKVISAIRVEENIVSGISKIEKYSFEATSSILPVREINNIDGVMKINNKSTSLISQELSMGFTNALKDVYKIDNIPKALELRTIEDVKNKPSFAVGENMRFTKEKFTPALSAKLDPSTKKIMESVDPDVKITPEAVERNPALKGIFDKMSGKTFKTVTGVLVSIGVGTLAVCAAVNEHRNRLTACMLYYYNQGQLVGCVIPTCTCKPVDCTSKCNNCSLEIQQKYLPVDMLKNNCNDFKGVGCSQCPSDAYNKANLSNDSTLTTDDISDYHFVKCQRPNFFEALTDLFGGVSEDLMNIVKGGLSGIGWLIQKLPYIILFSVIGIIIIIIISIFSKFAGNNKIYPQPPPQTYVSEL